MTRQETRSNEVVHIGSGLDSLERFEIPHHVQSVNLHGNALKRIQGLSTVALGQNLRILDLSGNSIQVVEGLEALVNLRCLNLAANGIARIGPGLANMRVLETLNLSYNRLESLDGLECFAQPRWRLRSLFLHGNRVHDVDEVCRVIGAVATLRTLTFKAEEATNPVCRNPRYPTILWTAAPGIVSLDGKNYEGADVTRDGAGPERVEIEDLLEFLTSEDSETELDYSSPQLHSVTEDTLSTTSESQTNLVRSAYPRIEAALSQFRKQVDFRDEEEIDRLPSRERRIEPPASERPRTPDASQMDRLENVEQQLQKLLEIRQSPDATSIKNADEGTQTLAAKEEGTQTEMATVCGPEGKEREKNLTEKEEKNDKGDDYLRNLLSQLDEEREKRWTVQQQCDALVGRLNEVEEKRSEERKQIEGALSLVRRLQQRLTSGKAAQEELETKLESVTVAKEKAERETKLGKQRETALQRLLRENEERTSKKISELEEKVVILETDLDDATKRERIALKEGQIFKSQAEQFKSLIADKEKDHQEALKGKYSIGSFEIQTLLTKEGDRISDMYKTQVESWRSKYEELEDEFRLALHLEAERFNNLEAETEKLKSDNVGLNSQLAELTTREARASALVKELSELAKDQKVKMTEMLKSNQNAIAAVKKRAEIAESALAAARERLHAMEDLARAKSDLETKYAALENLVKNIQAEKELWSSELAQQGAALSQDRGRLEAKAEALSAEVVSLKKQLERDTDALRIKAKVIDDQTETIKKLKEGLVEKDQSMKEVNERRLADEKELKLTAENEARLRMEAEETVEYLERRKEELKLGLAAKQREMVELKSNHQNLVEKWKERTRLIDGLEKKVVEMKRSWDEKEAKLTQDLNAAVRERDETRGQAAAIDDAFRAQLDQAQAAHIRALKALEAEKDREIEEANERLAAVEDEMRSILQEATEERSRMDLKIRKLTNAFVELQQPL